MNYKYPANTSNQAPNLPLRAENGRPVDERIVILTREDLVNKNTWGVMYPTGDYSNMTYDGIIVSVVDDPIFDNNGVYYLRKKWKYLTFADTFPSDPAGTQYDQDGWKKLGTDGGGGQTVYPDNYTIKDGIAEPDDSDERQSGFHVVRVDGGEFN